MSYPPEVKLGREDLKGWGWSIYSHGSAATPKRLYEIHNLERKDIGIVAALILWKWGFPHQDIARLLGVSEKTARKWRRSLELLI